MFAHRRLDVLLHGQAREQRALLKQHAPAPFDLPSLRRRHRIEIAPLDLYDASALRDQAKDRAGQHRLARPRGADKSEHLSTVEVEIEAVHHQLVVEADLKTANADLDLRFRCDVAQRAVARSRRNRDANCACLSQKSTTLK